MEKNKLIHLMALKKTRGMSNSKIIELMKYFKTPKELYNSKDVQKIVNQHNHTDEFEEFKKTIEYCAKNNIQIITYFDTTYPYKLKTIENPPLILYTKGNIKLMNTKSISIVGCRTISERATKWTMNISTELSNNGYTIVTGGALGTDISANKGALNNTIVVLGSGIDNPYPKENMKIFNEISRKGLIVSEYEPSLNVNKYRLLERNRITSGLGDIIILVDANINGGSMCQFKVAKKQSKKILCPNPLLRLEQKEGITKLINENNITTINNSKEVIDALTSKKSNILSFCV